MHEISRMVQDRHLQAIEKNFLKARKEIICNTVFFKAKKIS